MNFASDCRSTNPRESKYSLLKARSMIPLRKYCPMSLNKTVSFTLARRALHQDIMIDHIEKLFEIKVKDPPFAFMLAALCFSHRLPSASASLCRARRGLAPPSRCALPGTHKKNAPGVGGSRGRDFQLLHADTVIEVDNCNGCVHLVRP